MLANQMNTLRSKLSVGITTPLSTLSYSTIIGAALVNESVDKLVLSIKVGSAGEQIDLGASNEYLNVSTTWLDLTYTKMQTSYRNHYCNHLYH